MREIIIDQEFKELIPPLSEKEREQLETNIVGDGIRDPIVTWNGILIDGHNRYEIAKEYNIDFEVKEMEFGSRDEVKIWITQNQLGRRNLDAYQRSKLALKLKPTIKGKTPNVRDDLAELAEVSTNTFQRVDYIEQHGSDEVKAALDAGEISINKAYNEVKPPEVTKLTGLKGSPEERRDALLEKLPSRESKIGLPYQNTATRCIKDLIDGDMESALDGVMELLKNPTPTTIAMAKIILRAM